ncbi:MAG: DUF1801 domain-containing protein [Candidatus Cyclobacteriaceae bacterium M3_2C_046]
MNALEDFIYELPEPQQAIMNYLHQMIISFPEITGKIRYKIPFYYRKSWICYLNPIKDRAVELAFTRANELSNQQEALLFNGRKQVAGITFYSKEEISRPLIEQILQEAILLDDSIPYASKRKNQAD